MSRKILATAAASAIATFLAVGATIYPKPTKAVSASSPSGACGGTFSFARKGKTREGDGEAVNALAYFNFDTSSMELQLTLTDGFDAKPYYTTDPKLTSTFTVQQGAITGSWRIVPQQHNLPEINVLPVNGGNTFLMQAIDDDIVGMCQKV